MMEESFHFFARSGMVEFVYHLDKTISLLIGCLPRASLPHSAGKIDCRIIRFKAQVHINRPFSSCLAPLFQSESWCMALHMKMSFHSHANKN